MGTTPPYCRREPPTRRTSRAVPFGAFSAKPPTSRAIHTAGDTTRTVSAFPAAPYVVTRGHANLLGAGSPITTAAKRAYVGKVCQTPRSLGAYMQGALSNLLTMRPTPTAPCQIRPASAGLLGLSRAGALAMCAYAPGWARACVWVCPPYPFRARFWSDMSLLTVQCLASTNFAFVNHAGILSYT